MIFKNSHWYTGPNIIKVKNSQPKVKNYLNSGSRGFLAQKFRVCAFYEYPSPLKDFYLKRLQVLSNDFCRFVPLLLDDPRARTAARGAPRPIACPRAGLPALTVARRGQQHRPPSRRTNWYIPSRLPSGRALSSFRFGEARSTHGHLPNIIFHSHYGSPRCQH